MRSSRIHGRATRLVLTAVLALSAGVASGILPCGPFTDVSSADPFCPFVLEIFTLGITTGTTPTTYDPSGNVTRLQMAAFLSRTVDKTLHRGSRRAALGQFWTTKTPSFLGMTTFGASSGLRLIQSDGTDVWIADNGLDRVQHVVGSNGAQGAPVPWPYGNPLAVLPALGWVFFTTADSWLGSNDITNASGSYIRSKSLGVNPTGIAYDGDKFWTANQGAPGSVSILTPVPPGSFWPATTVTTGFGAPTGMLYDGSNIWVTDNSANTLLKLASNGAILQTVTVGINPYWPVFDGANIWVPNSASPSISVVRASTGAVLATLTGHGLSEPLSAAFDGERVLVTNGTGDNVLLYKAADLTWIATIPTGDLSLPYGACSDGVNFWVSLYSAGAVLRF